MNDSENKIERINIKDIKVGDPFFELLGRLIEEEGKLVAIKCLMKRTGCSLTEAKDYIIELLLDFPLIKTKRK